MVDPLLQSASLRLSLDESFRVSLLGLLSKVFASATNTSSNASPNATDHPATPTAWSSRPQLRCGCHPHLGCLEEGLVLPAPPCGMPFNGTTTTTPDCASFGASIRAANSSTTASRSLQLRRWICKLAGGVVCGQEGMVLQGPWQGMPRSSGWM